MTQIKSIMSKKVKTISGAAKLQEAYALMQELRVRHLPVLNDDGDVFGVISYKNLITNKSTLSMPVELFMSTPVAEVHESTSVKKAIFKMLEQKISSLLITNDDNEVVGIVTTDDLLWELASQLKDDDDSSSSVFDKGLQTVGEIARMLSQAGI